MRRALMWVCLTMGMVVAVAAQARADDPDREAQRKKEEAETLDRDLPKVAPDPGRDKAPVRPPPWCDALKAEGSWTLSSLGRSIKAAQSNGWGGLLESAMIACLHKDLPVVQKATAVIEQLWINTTGLSEAEALETFKARLAAEAFKADKEKLCDALSVSDEVEGEEKAFMTARRQLFGCTQKGWADKCAMWCEHGSNVPDDLITYIDASSLEVDELVRLAMVSDHVRFIFGERGSYFDHALLSYVTDQVDYKALSSANALKMLETEPYKGNVYARTVVLESLGRARAGIAAIEAEVKKKSSDAGWKELLVTAPQRGVAEWTAEMGKWKAAFARSNEFEHKFWGPSRKALKACWPALYADFVSIAKTLKHGNADELKESLSDPIASLLFARLAVCGVVDGDPHYGLRLLSLSEELRASRGPRMAAYYAALDALSGILADRAKFPVDPKQFWFLKNNALYSQALGIGEKAKTGMGFVGDSDKGIVKSVKKSGKGVVVDFQTQTVQMMGRSCTETNHILTFRNDGSPLYYQKCHDTGLQTVNITAGAITVPSEWASGVTVGSYMEFSTMIGKPPARIALPKAVYSDKAKKKLVNFYGIGL